ncbi:hypothetical protein ANCDUO_21341 [Ancylostoma duodenale]|uniref:Transmembrane protein n=1 Tax=Ancylostoma duodenale TaxID=51022 RepID=A0A0C2BX84_9BILA|nr:hypothetical protein ANCDUO_21341 [Ancylostoma duodenale]
MEQTSTFNRSTGSRRYIWPLRRITRMLLDSCCHTAQIKLSPLRLVLLLCCISVDVVFFLVFLFYFLDKL